MVAEIASIYAIIAIVARWKALLQEKVKNDVEKYGHLCSLVGLIYQTLVLTQRKMNKTTQAHSELINDIYYGLNYVRTQFSDGSEENKTFHDVYTSIGETIFEQEDIDAVWKYVSDNIGIYNLMYHRHPATPFGRSSLRI